MIRMLGAMFGDDNYSSSWDMREPSHHQNNRNPRADPLGTGAERDVSRLMAAGRLASGSGS
jgi:hypothetical protein